MNQIKLPNQPDVIMVYQDRDSVEATIQQILDLSFHLSPTNLIQNICMI